MKINENQKVTLTMGQLKRLVKEGRYSSQLNAIGQPEYVDTPNEYNLKKLRKALESISNNRFDLLEAVELLRKMFDIIDNRFEDHRSDEYNSAFNKLYVAGLQNFIINYDYVSPEEGIGECAFDAESDYAGRSHFSFPINFLVMNNPDAPLNLWYDFKNNKFAIQLDSDIRNLEWYSLDDFIVEIKDTEFLTEDELKSVINTACAMNKEIPNVFNTVNNIYDAFLSIEGIKLTEGRFSDKLKRLDSIELDEGCAGKRRRR